MPNEPLQFGGNCVVGSDILRRNSPTANFMSALSLLSDKCPHEIVVQPHWILISHIVDYWSPIRVCTVFPFLSHRLSTSTSTYRGSCGYNISVSPQRVLRFGALILFAEPIPMMLALIGCRLRADALAGLLPNFPLSSPEQPSGGKFTSTSL